MQRPAEASGVWNRFSLCLGSDSEYNWSEDKRDEHGCEDQKEANRGTGGESAAKGQIPSGPCTGRGSHGAFAESGIAAHEQHGFLLRCHRVVSLGRVGAETGTPDRE